jgi:hypothetical protein
MIKNEQSSSAVYGLFFEVEYEGQVLLGLYFLEGEAEAARQAYIATQLEDFSADERDDERPYYEVHTAVRRLAMGQVPSYNFSA